MLSMGSLVMGLCHVTSMMSLTDCVLITIAIN